MSYGNVTQDASSLRYVPANVTEFIELLTGSGVNQPSSIWLCNETSGSLADSGTAGRTVTVAGSPTYATTATGWSRPGIKPADGSATAYGTCTISDVNTTSCMLLQMFSMNTAATAARGLNRLGSASASHATLQSGNKLRGTSGANTDDGDLAQAGTLVVVTQINRSTSTFNVYTQGEKITPTWSAPAASTTLYLFGDATAASDATLVYAALWSGSDAEMTDTQVQALLDALESNMTTRQRLNAGSVATKTVVAIEGYDYLISNAPSAAVLDAWHGYDFTSVLGGLFVNIQNQQSIGKDDAFTSSGRCTIRVLDETLEDTLGKAIHKRLAGAETAITTTIDRNDTTIAVKSTTNFSSSGTAYIGTEAFKYTGTTATSFTGCTRGWCSPFGAAVSGSGGLRFGGHHRVGGDSNHVQMEPIVSQSPRVWIGKRVGVWLHTWDEENQKINHKREAQLVYAGRIVQIGDDAHTFTTVIELEHETKHIMNATLGRDPWRATLAGGLELIVGRVFKFSERISGTTVANANDLTVVSGTPASTNEIKAGQYHVDEIAAGISAWLAGEVAAARISGFYNMASPVSSNVGPRTKVYFRRENGTSIPMSFDLTMPGEVYAFLGIGNEEPGTAAQSALWRHHHGTNENGIAQGKKAPFHSLVFKPDGPGSAGQEFSEATTFDVENEAGEFIDQYALMPFAVKGTCDSSVPWGLFLLDERTIMVGSLTSGVLSNCWLAPFQMTGDNAPDSLVYIGRRVDEPERGPVTLRQFLCLEEQWKVLFKTLLYSTGVSGYNHGTYDTLSPALSVGVPGEFFGDDFERSIDNIPGAEVPVVVIIEEPTKFSEIVTGDMLLRRCFMRWKSQGFELAQWRTPLADNAALDVSGTAIALTEATKAAPATEENPQFRCSSVLTQELARPTIKFDYSREFALDRDGGYQKSFAIEDQTQVDDLGGNVKLQTIKLRNTFAGTSAVGAGLDTLLAEYLAIMPMFRPSLAIERSLDQRYFFELAPGDIVTVTDSFARDPITGARRISGRAGFVTSHSYTMGGFTASSGKDTQSGRIEINFLDVQRGETYAPCAQINETVSTGGFSAGYASGVPSIRCHQHKFGTSGLAYVTTGRRVIIEEADEASLFNAGDKILIIEIDPTDPASPVYWEREVLSQSDQDIVLTTTLSSPAWDSAKKYRVVPQKWSQVVAAQQERSFQADDADHMIEDDEVPFHYSASNEPRTYHPKTGSERGEYLPQLCYGDGRPYDVGHERALVDTINTYIDHKSAHQGAFLWSVTACADFVGLGNTQWNTLFAGPIFLGLDLLSGRVTRTLTVAPWFRSRDGSDSWIRVSIGAAKPQPAIDQDLVGLGVFAYRGAQFRGKFSQTPLWSSTSTTWGTGAAATLDVGVKDVHTGMAWLVVEGAGEAECRGLASCIEGVRVVG